LYHGTATRLVVLRIDLGRRYPNLMRGFPRLALIVPLFAAAATLPKPVIPSFARLRALIYRDDFTKNLDRWTAELQQPGTVEARGGALNIDVPGGCTLWFKPQLDGPVLISYQATMIKAGGPNDRVSDLNVFWMASDARSPQDLFATKRSGAFADYNRLLTYYVGQGGNTNTTTRFRRYIGEQDNRPLLPEHDLKSPDVLLKPNTPRNIQLVAFNDRIQYYDDGKLLFDFHDSAPYTRGHFAFRTVTSHIQIRGFRVYRLLAKP
jgi:hypothetical protein